MFSLMIAAVLVAQPKEMALDPVRQRRVYEAWRSGQRWAERQAGAMFHWKYALGLTRQQRVRYYAMQHRAEGYLLHGAAKQISVAYDIDRKTFESVVRDPRSRIQKFVEEPIGPAGIRFMGGDLLDMKFPTRFDPAKVVLPEKQAKEIGYVNPDPNNPPKSHMAKSYMPDGRRIPGAPRNPEEDARRREIEKRARETQVKETPIAVQPPKPLGSGKNVNDP